MAPKTLTVREVIKATPRTRILKLAIEESGFTFAAGQAVMAGLHGSPLRKPYSIASAPGEAAASGVIELLVQVDDTGGPDPHLELAQPGHTLDIDGPFGNFTLPPAGPDCSFLLIAGGTGIAPLRSLLIEALAQTPAPKVSVLYSARAPEELAYREEFEALASSGLVTLYLTVTRDENQTWSGRRGRIDEALLRAALPHPGARCLICGPRLFVHDTRERLKLVGVPDQAIVVEQYDR